MMIDFPLVACVPIADSVMQYSLWCLFFAWVFQPDIVWLYPGKELTKSNSADTIGKLKNIVVSEITAKYIL